MTRPAETVSAGGTIGLLVAYVLGVDDPETVLLIGAGVGLVPAVVTTLIAYGGVRGLALLLWRGRRGT